MKNLILILTFMIIGNLAAKNASANDVCFEKLSGHLSLIEESQVFYKELEEKKNRISSHEINSLQHSLEQRYASLNDLLNYYEDKNNECPSKFLSQAVAVYDFDLLRQSLLDNKTLRRVFNSFVNLEIPRIINLKKDFKVYTSKKYIDTLNENLATANLELPEYLQVNSDVFGKRAKFKTIGDISANTVTSTVSGAARVWGFISDRIIWRDGRLHKNDEAYELMRSSLKPLDVLYEKRKFTLANYTIPGFWGHTAVWLGTKEELEEIGVWDAPFFKNFQKYILAEKSVIEVRKEGVVFKTLREFMNIDEIAATRITKIESKRYEIIESLISQYGKKYDFKFDAHSVDRITCTEFITFSYGDLAWHQSKILFHMNIKPDDIARSTYGKNATSELVIYLKGFKSGDWVSKSYAGWLKQLKVNKKDLSYGDISRITGYEYEELMRMEFFTEEKSSEDQEDESEQKLANEEEIEEDFDEFSPFNLAPNTRALDIAPEFTNELSIN